MSKKEKMGLVFCIHPHEYEIFDNRISKPICFKHIILGTAYSIIEFGKVSPDYADYRITMGWWTFICNE